MSLTSITKNNLKTIERFRTFTGSLKKKKACIRQQGHSSFYVDGIFKSEKKTFRCGKRSTALVCGQTKIEY